jgi:integrase
MTRFYPLNSGMTREKGTPFMEKKDESTSKFRHRRIIREAHPLTIEQIKQLLSAAQGHPLNMLVTVALTTGLRSSEIVGLRWQDLDREDALLHVRQIILPLGKKEAPKAARTIALPRIALGVLEEQRSGQDEVRAKAGEAWHDLGLVFPNGRGQYLDPSTLGRQSPALFVAAGLPPLRFHDLRHTTAAFLLAMGAHPQVVQTILGYRSMSTTLNTLVPVSLSMQREVMQKWDDLFLEEGISPHQSNWQANNVENQEDA